LSIEQLTKAEILAMLDVQKEAATQMQKVASSLHDISKNQEALLESMSELEKTFRNGLCDKVIDKINEKMGVIVQPLAAKQQLVLETVKKSNDNVAWLKTTIGGATLMIVAITVILKVINPAPNTDDLIKVIRHQTEEYHHNLNIVNK